MKLTNPKAFSKTQTDNAGVVLCNPKITEDEKNKALDILTLD